MAEFLLKTTRRDFFTKKQAFLYDLITGFSCRLTPIQQEITDKLSMKYPEFNKDAIGESIFYNINPESKMVEILLEMGYSKKELMKR